MNTLKLTSPGALTRLADASDAALVHRLYAKTPGYFEVISIPVPTLAEVRTDLETAARDPRRSTELILLPPTQRAPVDSELTDPVSGRQVVGYLDYKLDYPEEGDATVNLLLVSGDVQGRGIGSRCVRDLEKRLHGRSRRILASIYGRNPRARRFWEGLGYAFAIDAKPVLDWYAKSLA
jgi:ribosomal protein S18 acetylase RimI-like enzyme